LAQIKKKRLAEKRRSSRVRYRIRQSGNRPRLSVFRSLRHIYAQIIDDINGITLASASTLSPELKDLSVTGNTTAAEKVGELIAKKARDKEIEMVTFDRGSKLYHGRIKALADSARANGLKF
jgi:large subunit ribosomal protein L18